MAKRVRLSLHSTQFAALAAAALGSSVVGAIAPSTAAAAVHAAKPYDFDGDGFRDLAIGIPGKNEYAGAVSVLYGGRDGVTTNGATHFDQDTTGMPGTRELGDRFGTAVASGDFDADGYADLAIGVPSENTGGLEDAGAVAIVYGTRHGLDAERSDTLRRPNRVLGDPDRAEAHFGFDLVAADFNGDGRDDLGASVSTNRGGVLIYFGRASGLARLPGQQFGPRFGLPDDDPFAFPGQLASGDLDGNGVADLVVGWPEHDAATGAVVVAYGASGHGIDRSGSRVRAPQVWTEDSPGVIGTAAQFDTFGSSVAVGDVTGDGRQDLVVSNLGEPTATTANGAIHVLRGTSHGVSAANDEYLTYDDLATDPIGSLGVTLDVGRLDGDRYADVAVTAGTRADHWWGRVVVVHGSADGLGAHEVQAISQATAGVGGVLTDIDYWGSAVAIRDLGRSRIADLIVGDPFEVVDGAQAGRINVIYGSQAGPRPGQSQTFTENTPGVPGAAEEPDSFGHDF